MIGTFVAQTHHGKSTLILQKDGRMTSAVTATNGALVTRSDSSWELIRKGENQQLLVTDTDTECADDIDPALATNCIDLRATAYPIDDIDKKIVIYTDSGRHEKQ